MLCQNCGKHEANVRYTQIINGNKKEMVLCEQCAHKLGIEENLNFSIPMDLPSFLGEFLGEYNDANFLPSFNTVKELKCDNCGMTYNEFINTGKFGCGNCYNVFEDRINPILKNLHGSNRHIGRKGKLTKYSLKEKMKNEPKMEKKENSEVDQLKEKLKEAIKEERYEDAAKLRDEIKKIDKNN